MAIRRRRRSQFLVKWFQWNHPARRRRRSQFLVKWFQWMTYQVSGLKNGDTAGAVLNGGSLSRVAGENVGVYGINQAWLARMSACTASTRVDWACSARTTT